MDLPSSPALQHGSEFEVLLFPILCVFGYVNMVSTANQ